MYQNPLVQHRRKNRNQSENDGADGKSLGMTSQKRGPATYSPGGYSPIAANPEGAGFY